MTIYLAKYSALESLAATAWAGYRRATLSETHDPRWTPPQSEDIRLIVRRCPFLTSPIQIVVPSIDFRRNLRGATFNVSTHARRPGALRNITSCETGAEGAAASKESGPTLGVSAPAFCLAQLAGKLPFSQLAELACSLAGLYKFAPSRAGSILDAEPITSVTAMSEWLARNSDTPGAARAQRALSYAIDRLGSPAETLLYLLLCLPRKSGGYGFPRPHSNSFLAPTTAQRHRVSQNDYHPDLYWPEKHLIVEYDSDQYHSSPDRAALDAKRRNDLEAMGYRVIVVTRAILRQEELFEKVADQIRRRLGVRAIAPTAAWRGHRKTLQQELLGITEATRRWR